jgi:hypothetical protein
MVFFFKKKLHPLKIHWKYRGVKNLWHLPSLYNYYGAKPKKNTFLWAMGNKLVKENMMFTKIMKNNQAKRWLVVKI